MTPQGVKPLRIGFVHPDLGIGGAERLVVDAAVGLQKLGHHVEIFTSFHDPKRCFRETVDGTLQVHVLGNSIFPRSLAGRFTILCAILRQLCLVVSLIFSIALHTVASPSKPTRDSHDWSLFRVTQPFDVFFVDQLSVGIPPLRWLTNTRALFYCHFPDLLMNPDRTGRSSLLRRFYRLPFDKLEELTTGCADKVLVNSEFTSDIFVKTFPGLRRIPRVVYPGIDASTYDQPPASPLLGERKILLSINRFEAKKNLMLALDAFAKLKDRRELTLVFAGGFDSRLVDNIATLEALQNRCTELELSNLTHIDADMDTLSTSAAAVVFLPNLPEREKAAFLRSPTTAALLYTPWNEHLGIVPLEAMASGLPVLACASGGPLETVDDPSTGRLRKAEPEEWAEALEELLSLSAHQRKTIAEAGRQRVKERFDLQIMAKELDRALRETRAMDQRGNVSTEDAALFTAMFVGFALAMLFVVSMVFSWTGESRFQDVPDDGRFLSFVRWTQPGRPRP